MRSLLFSRLSSVPKVFFLYLLMSALGMGWGIVACSDSGGAPSAESEVASRLQVVASVAPLVDIVAQVGGDSIELSGLVPPGVNSHTFEPAPSDAIKLAQAQVIFLNGLQLEALILDLVVYGASGQMPAQEWVLLGDQVLDQREWIFDFSFPQSGGAPNPHLWMDPTLVMAYVEIIGNVLATADANHTRAYAARAAAYTELLQQLDEAIVAAVDTIPPEQRQLLTYHDSWAYFARRYGLTVIGAMQPADMSEPSAKELADFIRQVRETGVRVIFGAQEFPSSALRAIARETGVELNDKLTDDVLPGEPGSAEHTYIGMMKRNVSIMVEALGGDAKVLQDVPAHP